MVPDGHSGLTLRSTYYKNNNMQCPLCNTYFRRSSGSPQEACSICLDELEEDALDQEDTLEVANLMNPSGRTHAAIKEIEG